METRRTDMEYEIEELLPLVKRLSERYTLKESSSVTYETAGMLMEAVLYCVREGMEGREGAVSGGIRPLAEQMYERGREIIVDKAYQAKQIYEELISDWEDYGCVNYRNTVQDGMREFFARYDVQFQPQNHLLLLDYPLLCEIRGLCGVDLILEYLKRIHLEKSFLDCLHREAVVQVLEQAAWGSGDFYMGNLCEPVLLTACGCVMAGRPAADLRLGQEELIRIRENWKQKGPDENGRLIREILRRIGQQVPAEGAAEYLEQAGPGFLVRIQNGVETGSLKTVFSV